MKKILIMIGAIGIAGSGASTVIACGSAKFDNKDFST